MKTNKLEISKEDRYYHERNAFRLSPIRQFLVRQMNKKGYILNDEYYTPEQFSNYDCMLTFKSIFGDLYSLIIEIKTRDEMYNDYILERSKLNKLKKKQKSMMWPSSILYVNFTCSDTFLWKLNNYKGKLIKKEMPKQTYGDNTWILKPVYLLESNIAKRFDYGYNMNKEQKLLEESRLPKKKENISLF